MSLWKIHKNKIMIIVLTILYQVISLILMCAASFKFENSFKEKGILIYDRDSFISRNKRMWFMRKIMFYMLIPIFNVHIFTNSKNAVNNFIKKHK